VEGGRKRVVGIFAAERSAYVAREKIDTTTFEGRLSQEGNEGNGTAKRANIRVRALRDILHVGRKGYVLTALS